MKTKVISMLLLCSFILLSLSACMNEEEERQAKENERIAKPLIESFIDENYRGSVLIDVDCITNTGGSVFSYTYATDCVKAKVLRFAKPFNVIVNLKTNEFYTNYNKNKVINELKDLLLKDASFEIPHKIEIKFIEKSLNKYIKTEGIGFLSEDIDNVKDLLKSDKYKMLTVCKYANSKINFKEIPIKSFFKDEYKSTAEVAFINYRSIERYDSSNVPSDIFSFSSLNYGRNTFFNISEVKIAKCNEENGLYNDEQANISSYSYKEEYNHYKSQIFNGVEFIWNEEHYDIDFSLIEAEPIIATEDYKGDLLYAKNDKAIKLNCKTKHNEPLKSEIYVYDKLSSAGSKIILMENKNIEIRELLDGENYTYQNIFLNGYNHEIILGFYDLGDTLPTQKSPLI